MPFSGSKDFGVTRSELLLAAMRKIGTFDAGDEPAADEIAHAAFSLNVIVKNLAVKGVHISLRETVTVFLQPSQQSYQIGPGGDNATSSYVETTLSAAAAAAATTVSLTSYAGMTNGDYIGIKLDDNTIHWTTIVDRTVTTITTGLASAAASGARVYTYTTKANRPHRLVWAHRRDSSGYDSEVTLIGDIAYRSLSNKAASGPVNQAFYQPTLTTGTLFVWPVDGGASVDKLMLVAEPMADDMDAAGNNPQFPIEAVLPLIYAVAADLAPEAGIGIRERRELRDQARELMEDWLNDSVENASVVFGMDAL